MPGTRFSHALASAAQHGLINFSANGLGRPGGAPPRGLWPALDPAGQWVVTPSWSAVR